MSGWQAGDLAVCVDASAWPNSEDAPTLLSKGAVYRVLAFTPSYPFAIIGSAPGLELEGVIRPWRTNFFAEQRFRKIRPDAHEGSIEDWRDLVEFFTKRVNA